MLRTGSFGRKKAHYELELAALSLEVEHRELGDGAHARDRAGGVLLRRERGMCGVPVVVNARKYGLLRVRR